jgi:hypothetical protein
MGGYAMKAAEESRFLCLVPYDPAEAISLSIAATRAGKSETTVRNWCEAHGLGRRVGGGTWQVSQVALAMFLDDDKVALCSYLSGDRSSPAVSAYFRRFNLKPQSSQ